MRDDYAQWVKKIKKEIERNRKRFAGKRCVLFGASDANRVALKELQKWNIRIDQVIDNNTGKTGLIWERVPVTTPSFLQERFDPNTMVVICGGEFVEKKRQVMFMGYTDQNILIILPERKSRLDQLRDVADSIWVYERVKRRSRGKHILFLPLQATGDAYLTGMYLSGYIAEQEYRDYQIVVTSGGVKKMLQLFGFEDVLVISLEEGKQLKEAVSRFGESQLNLSYLMFWGLYSQNLIRLEEYCKVSFHEMFRNAVFGYQDRGKAEEPEFCCNVEEIFIKEKLIEGRTVLLSPYAVTFDKELDEAWWKALADALTERGFLVCTNSTGFREPVVNGTKGVAWDYRKLVPLLNLAGYFIGVRSGLCDLISSSSCKKVILYQKNMSKNKMSYFSLNHMGLCSDAIEIKLGEEGDAAVLEKIIKIVGENV